MYHPDDQIGPYTLLRKLGRGAFGEVWLAGRRSTLLTTQVALKMPLDGTADLDGIRREAEIWVRASGHPNIVPVLEAEIYDGQVIIASEFVAGGSLSDWLEANGGKAPSTPAAVEVVRGILAGLAHLHANSLIHRDIKPDNVLLQSSVPRLTDFGLSRHLQVEAQSSHLSGSPVYMAPEAFQGRYSNASDLWSVGMVLCELLSGELPYSGLEFYPLLLQITSETPVPLPDHIPDELRPIVARALVKPAGERFGSAEEMSAALVQAGARETAAVQAASAPPMHNIPAQATSFIGRSKELGEIGALLSRTRLLTLTGSGGCGKTRLALQLGLKVAADYTDGVWLVELASLTDAALIGNAVAQAVGVTEQPGRRLTDMLIDHMGDKNLLLVLDNCEHVLADSAVLLEAILQYCPNVKALTSSRESLNIPGELSFRVPSLTLPDLRAPNTAETVREYEAASLFLERAQFHEPHFVLTDHDAPYLATVCCRLDGIPLAIELAAARVRSLPVQQIATRLDDRFRLLTGGHRTALPRQQTLRALIDWSYNLLTDQERRLLARLAVFAGGWTLEAAEAICVGHPIEGWEVLDLLTSLVDKSLAVYDGSGTDARYRFLETVRQYARDRLMEAHDLEHLRARHRDHFVSLGEAARKELSGPRQSHWFALLDRDHDNLRAALDFCEGDPEGAKPGLALSAALQVYWWTRGHFSEGRARLAAALAHPGAPEHKAELSDALNGAGALARLQGDFREARRLHEQGLALSREIGDASREARALGNIGVVVKDEGDHLYARTMYEESLAISRKLGDRAGTARSLANLGIIEKELGDYAAARALYDESLVILREIGDRVGVSYVLNAIGTVALLQEDYLEARAIYTRTLEIKREMGDRHGIAFTLGCLGNVARQLGELAMAQALHEESLAIRQELGDRNGIACSGLDLGRIALDRGDRMAAGSSISECIQICAEIGATPIAVLAFEALAEVSLQEQRFDPAALLYGLAEAYHKQLGTSPSPGDGLLIEAGKAQTAAALGAERFETHYAAAAAMSLREASDFVVRKWAPSVR